MCFDLKKEFVSFHLKKIILRSRWFWTWKLANLNSYKHTILAALCSISNIEKNAKLHQVLNHSTIISILESRIMQPGIFLNFRQLILKWFFFAGIMKTALALMMSATWPMTTVSGATTLILMLDSVIQVHNLFLFCNYFLFHFLRS